jgi:hypothetical protein
MIPPIDSLPEELKQWATPTQARYLDAVNQHGSLRKAAAALGVAYNAAQESISRLQKKAARAGFAPGHWNDGVAPGYVMGNVTIQRRNEDGTFRWERQSPDQNARQERFQALLEAAKEEFAVHEPLRAPTACDADLLTIYPVGDPHCGLYTWEEETGTKFDLGEFERIQKAAIDRLVASTPRSHTAIFNDKGDSTHADNNKNRTPRSGHELDVHGRHGEVMRVSLRVKRYQIARLLEKHAHVIVRVDPGNHDPDSALHLALVLEALYENEPRVQVVTSPNPYWYHLFGKNLIGTCHGDGAKGPDLPLLMATDVPELWGQADYRVWLVGHVHHKWVKDYNGCTVEYLRTLAPSDAHHHGAGYRSKRTLEAITLHRTDHEVERHTCSMRRIERLAA